jgi:hypothetical protein
MEKRRCNFATLTVSKTVNGDLSIFKRGFWKSIFLILKLI